MIFSELSSTLKESDEYNSFKLYKKLSPKMKDAVQYVYDNIDNSEDILVNFEKNIEDAAKKYNLSVSDLKNYFEDEDIKD